MTGLDIEKDHILEIACIVTDKRLNIISEELNIVIHQSDTILNNMNLWSTEHHEEVILSILSYMINIFKKIIFFVMYELICIYT